jgi:hypothetical protein
VPELAVEIGLNESIMLLQIAFWINQANNLRDGRWWTYQSVRDMQQKAFPYWSIATINRAATALEAAGFIVVGNYNSAKFDRTRWFALNTENIANLTSVRLVFQNDTRITQDDTRTAQNDTTIPETTTETTTEGEKKLALPAPNPTPAEVDTAIYGTSEEAPITLDEAKRILDLPAHLRNTTLDNMASLPLIDAYAEGIGAPYIATRADKVNALRAIMAGYTPDDMRATVKAKRKPDKPYALSWAISDLASVKAAGTAKPRMVGHMLDDLDPEAPDYWERVAERLNSPKKVIA